MALAAAGVLAFLAPAAEAAFPGKPGRIVYQASLPGSDESTPPPNGVRDYGADIFTVNPDGSGRLKLTGNGPEPDDESGPSWSPDGSLIVFSTAWPFAPGTPYPVIPPTRLELMNADGSNRRVLPLGGFGPGFYPSGDRIWSYNVDVDGLGPSIISYPLAGGEVRQEAGSPGQPLPSDWPEKAVGFGPALSPDGRTLVSVRSIDCCNQTSDLFLSNRDGSGPRQITFSPARGEFGPVFAPDGSAVAYTTDGQVAVLDLRSGVERIVSDPAIPSFGPDWGAVPVKCGGRRATLVGTAGKDRLVGTSGRDVITALAGRDTIKGKGGRDILCSGSGRDRVIGGKGRDRCVGAGGDSAKGCERPQPHRKP